MSYQKAREDFIAVLIEDCKDMAAFKVLDTAKAILRDANTVQRLEIEDLNRGLSDEEKTRLNRAMCRISHRCSELGLTATFGEDPRGAIVRVHLRSDRYNTLGGKEEGWGVPTRD